MSNSFYSVRRRTEPDMRAEFNAMMDGIFPEIPKAKVLVLRKMKRSSTDPIITDTEDPNYDTDRARKFYARGQIPDYFVPGEGYLIGCDCIDKVTSEPDIDYFCPICQGEGFIWEEIFIDVYKVTLHSDVGQAVQDTLIKSGLTNIPLVIFYTRSSVEVTKTDKIIEIWTDSEGNVIRPYRRKALYRIGSTIDFRSDDGRLEYWKLDCYEERRKYLNDPRG